MFPHGGNDDDERSDNDSIDNGVIEKNAKAGETERDKRRNDIFDSFLFLFIYFEDYFYSIFNIPTGAYTSIHTSGGMLGLYHILC